MPEREIVKRATEIGLTAGMAAIGGMAHYLYKHYNGMPFRLGMFVTNAVLSAFVGTLVGSFLDPSAPYRDGIIGLSGFSSLHILGFMENGGWKYVVNAFLRASKLPEIK